MAVRDPLAQGGKVTQRVDSEEDVARLANIPAEGLEQLRRVFWDAKSAELAGTILAGQRQAAVAEPRDVSGEVIKGYAEVIKGALGAAKEMVGTKGDDTYAKYMLDRLTKLDDDYKALLQAPAPDRFAEFQSMYGAMKTLAEDIAKKQGVPEPRVQPSDLPRLMELEQSRHQHEEKMLTQRQQFDQQMEEQRRRWAKEDQKWEMDFKLKMAELAGERERKDRAASQLSDLMTAVAGGIEVERGVPAAEHAASQPAAAQPPAVSEPRIPNQFKCENCGAMVENPERKIDVVCPKCGAEYTMKPM